MSMSDTHELDRLYAAGVDNWEGYDEALRTLPDDASDSDVLRALYAAGVDNWEGYDLR